MLHATSPQNELHCPVTGITCLYGVPQNERTCYVQEMRICSIECAHHWAHLRGREVHAEHRVVHSDLFGVHHEFHFRTRRPPPRKSEGPTDIAWASRFSGLESELRIRMEERKKKKPPD